MTGMGASFIVGPHPQYFQCPLGLKNLIDEAMLDVYSSRIITGKISDEFFIRGRILEWIDAQDREQRIDAIPKSSRFNLLRVLVGVPRENEFPAHQGNLLEHLPRGVFMPLTRDSRMPGTLRR